MSESFFSVRTGDTDLEFRRPKIPESNPRYDRDESDCRVLHEGYKKSAEYRAFSVPTVYEKDVKIPLRDGIILKGDIFRPACDERIPAIVPWSPYGKSGRGLRLDDMPGCMGIPKSRRSGFEKFEGPDPAEWTARGYAVVNIDSRGSWDSQGYLCWAGTQEGRDGYDAIEWIAALPWCNGSVCTAGNSWLGRAQWYIAAEQPPSLKCIAPLEASSDLYREIHVRGGISSTPFLDWMMATLCGRGQMEDPVAMTKKFPLMNDYWRDKRANIDRIQVPAYILASYSTSLHLPGSLRGFEEILHDNKWLRIHATQEWHDLYQQSTNDELQLFFDRYTKGINNGFEEKIPRVRASLIGYNTENIVNHPFRTWPPPNTTYQRLYLTQDQRLMAEAPLEYAVTEYPADRISQQIDDDVDEALFQFTFKKRSFLLGSVKAVLAMSCADHDDLDVFLSVRKTDASGKCLRYANVPSDEMSANGIEPNDVPLLNLCYYLGPHGQIRASHRAIDEEFSKPHYLQHKHEQEEKIPPGTVVEVATSLWPGGIVFNEGESLVFKVSGHPMTLAEFPTLRGCFVTQNTGKHQIHCGGEKGSYIEVPFVNI